MKLKRGINNFTNELDKKRKLNINTIRQYKLHLSRFVDFLGEDKNLQKITLRDCKTFLRKLKARQITQSVINRHSGSVRRFFHWCFLKGYIPKSPAIELTGIRYQRSRTGIFTLKELNQIINCDYPYTRHKDRLQERDNLLFLTLASTGIWVTECAELNWEDIDFKKQRLRIKGKGRRKARFVYLNNKLASMLFKIYKRDKPGLKEPIFTTELNRRMSQNSINVLLKKTAKHCGIEKRVYPNMIRASFVFHLFKKRAAITSISHFLGNEALDTILKYHPPLDDRALKEDEKKLYLRYSLKSRKLENYQKD